MIKVRDCVFQDGSYPCGSRKEPDCELCLKAFKAGIKEAVEMPHLDGKCTGDLECFCMVRGDECDDPHSKDFPKEPMYPSDIAHGEGRLIFISKAKLKEWEIV